MVSKKRSQSKSRHEELTEARRKKVTKESKFFLRHPLFIPVSTFLVLFFVGLIGFVTLGGSTQGASDARIVNVYSDGEQQTVTTRAKTVGELIDRLELNLIKEDIVEPSKDTQIIEDNTQVNIYRARPVEVVDKGRIITLLTAQRAPRLVAAEAGVDLKVEDEVSFERTNDSVLESSVSERLVIDRSVEVQLNLYGAIKQFRTTADNIEELLAEEGVSPGVGDSVSPDIKSRIKSNMLISVNRPGIKTVVVNESIKFEVEIKDDADLEAGKTSVQRKGEEGKRAVVYEVTEINGKTKRKKLQEVVLSKPVDEIRLRGTKIIAPSFNPTVTVSGDKAALMSAAGIAESDFAYVDYIVSKESGWRPGAANTYSGAYGLCQSLPASKMASAGADYLTNPITQLRWCSGYASGRYGSWAGAYSAWLVQGWW